MGAARALPGQVLETAQLQIGFATAVDGRVPKIVENLPVVQPTFMAGVPRIFEKIYAGAIKNGTSPVAPRPRSSTGPSPSASAGEQEERRSNHGGWQYNLADKLVFSKIKEKMGGRIRYFISGSAALSGTIAEWFDAAGLTILEGYGLTETSAATTIMRPDNIKFGTVGEPLAGTGDRHRRRRRDPDPRRRRHARGYRNLPEPTPRCSSMATAGSPRATSA